MHIKKIGNKIIFISMLLLFVMHKDNNKVLNLFSQGTLFHQNQQYDGIFKVAPQGSLFFEEDDRVYLYDSLTSEPLPFSLVIDSIISHIRVDSIKQIECANEYTRGNIVTCYFQHSYLKIFENLDEGKCVLLDFVISDQKICLCNKIYVGMHRCEFNALYSGSVNKESQTTFYLTDESQLSEIACYFKNDTIYKLIFLNTIFPDWCE